MTFSLSHTKAFSKILRIYNKSNSGMRDLCVQKVYTTDAPRGIRSLSHWNCFDERAADIIEGLARESEMPKSKGRRSADDGTF